MRIVSFLTVTLFGLVGLFTPIAQAQINPVKQENLVPMLIKALKSKSVSDEVLNESSKLDLAFGFRVGDLRINLGSADDICGILFPNTSSTFSGGTRSTEVKEVLLVGRQGPRGYVTVGEHTDLGLWPKVLGILGKAPYKAAFGNVDYNLVLVKATVPENALVNTGALDCE